MGKKAKKPETEPESVPGTPVSAAGSGRNTILTGAVIAAVIIAVVLIVGTPFLNLSPPQTPGSGITVYYFYGTECPHCHNVTPYIESLRQKYPDVEFRILEIWHNKENNALARLTNHNLNQTQEGVPEAVVGRTVLFGETDITTKLESAILAQKKNLTETSVLAASVERGASSDPVHPINATYFYGNGCSHCESVKPLIADIQARYPELRLEMLEINDNKTNRDRFLAMRTGYGLGFAGSIPTVFIGNRALEGEANVTDHFEESILAEKQRIASGTPVTLTPSVANVSVAAVYFYSDSCSHCERIKPVIENISARNPDLMLSRLEINHNADNRQQLIDLSSRFNISNPGVPTLFIGNQVLIGEAEITNRFEAGIRSEEVRIASGNSLSLPNLSHPAPAVPALNPYMVIFAALVDSANPCGLSVLVFLLISMAAAGNRKRILLVGGVYIAAMFLFHLFVGIGLFSAMAISGLTKPFSLIGGIIALVLGIITLADVLRKRETFLLSIPESGKGMLGTYARKATLPAAFILGILAGILGFSCTGGIYISILGLMGRDMTVMAGLPYLVLYNLIFVLPLVLVTLLVAYGLSPDRAERWRTEHKYTIRGIIGIILVALGLVILLGWLG